MTMKLTNRMRRFLRETDGNATIEAAVFIPLMLSVLLATFSLHDAFRYKSLNTKAAYTISDALSRETDPVDDLYLDGMVNTLEFLTRSEGPYSLRVTQLRYDDEDGMEVLWSQTRGSFEALTTAGLTEISPKLPNMLHNERILVVETRTEYNTPFDLKIMDLDTSSLFYNLTVTRPRFAPQLVWAGV